MALQGPPQLGEKRVTPIHDCESEEELARSTREKKFGADQPVEFKDKARQMRFLQYRGFETDHIQTAVSDSGD